VDERNGPEGSPPRFAGAAFDVVAIIASAGGLQALSQVIGALPAAFPAAVLVLQHVDPRHRSLLADILRRRTALVTKPAQEGELLEAGVAYIAQPDRHLLLTPDGTISLTRSELVHFVRPSGDLLLESAAACFKDRAIACVLTGTGVDGSSGVVAIRKMGGTVIAQDEESSAFFGMPAAAIQTGSVDFVLPLHEIGPALVRLVTEGEKP